MTLVQFLSDAVAEANRMHPGGGGLDPAQIDKDWFPTFYTAKNGLERNFSHNAVEALQKFAILVHQNDAGLAARIRLRPFTSIVFQCFANLHADGSLRGPVDGGSVATLKREAAEAVAAAAQTYTHFFPAWTLGVEHRSPLSVGPVKFHSRDAWFDNLSHEQIGLFLLYDKRQGLQADEAAWRETVGAAIKNPGAKAPVGVISGVFIDALQLAPSLLEVSVGPGDRAYTRERAKIAARAALDSLGLLFNDHDIHDALVLQEDPKPPVTQGEIYGDTAGRLLANTHHNRPVWHGDPQRGEQAVSGGEVLVTACGRAISAFVDPTTHPAPGLAQRWITALNWYADGCREASDYKALSMVATSLDVLSCAGKNRGILELLVHVMGIDENKIITTWPEKSLKSLVAEIYDAGRSRILHGTHADPMRSFSSSRQAATALARMALRHCVVRWAAYVGPDEDEAFRSMPDIP